MSSVRSWSGRSLVQYPAQMGMLAPIAARAKSDNTPGTQAGIQCAVLHVHILYARDIPDPTGGGSVKSNTLAAKYVTDVRKVHALIRDEIVAEFRAIWDISNINWSYGRDYI